MRLVDRAREAVARACLKVGMRLLGIDPEKLPREEEPEEDFVAERSELGARAREMIERGAEPRRRPAPEPAPAPLEGSLQARGR